MDGDDAGRCAARGGAGQLSGDGLADPDARALDIEAQLTDDERFSLLVGVMGASDLWPLPDKRIPRGFR